MEAETTTSYDYSENFTDEECDRDTVIAVGSIAVPIFFSIVVLFSLVGNILVLVILGLYESLRSLTNVFILNLAVSDLMFTAGLPFWSWYYMWGWTLGDVACKGVSFVFFAGFYSSVVFLMLMTVQRYMAVLHPLSDWETGQKFAVIPVVAWLFSIMAALPALLFYSVKPHYDDLVYCDFISFTSRLIIIYEQNVFFLLAFFIMGFCYISILHTIYKRPTKRRHRTIKLIFCIVAVFFVGWAPYNLSIFLDSLVYWEFKTFTECEVSNRIEYLKYVSKLLAFSHCCLNPVFYVFLGVKFRNHLKAILRKLVRAQSSADLQRPRTGTVLSQGSMY